MTNQIPAQIANIQPVETVTGNDADYTSITPTLLTEEEKLRQGTGVQFTPAGVQQQYQQVPEQQPQQLVPQQPQQQYAPQQQQLPPWMQPQPQQYYQQQDQYPRQAPPQNYWQQPLAAPQQPYAAPQVPQQPPQNGVAPSPQQQPQQPPQQTQPQQQYDPNHVQQVLMTTFGLGIDDLRAGMQYIQQQRSQQLVQEARQQVVSQWGVDQQEVDRRLYHIRSYYETLPAEMRQAYEIIGADAVPILWDKVTRQYPAITNASPVPMDRSEYGSVGGGSGYWFTRSQLNKMSDADRRAQDARILHASANGLIYEDE